MFIQKQFLKEKRIIKMETIYNNLGFGGASLTSMKSYSAITNLLNIAYQQGIRHYDTAVLYGKGYSELIFGQLLKNKRQTVTITTKYGLGQPFETSAMPVQVLLPLNYYIKRFKKALNYATESALEPPYKPVEYRLITKNLIEKSFNDSLKRLQTDYVDYYLLHEGLPFFLTDDAFSFLLDLKRKGCVRFIGLGCNVLDVITLHPNELNDWDVLQYEGYSDRMTSDMMLKFPDKVHFHHSCLKKRNDLEFKDIDSTDKIGFILAQAAKRNPKGKIIFSTRNPNYLIDNMSGFSKYYSEGDTSI